MTSHVGWRKLGKLAIEKVVKSGLVTSKEIVPWFSHNEEYKTQIMQYRLHLMQLVNVCAPLAKSLRCLEAPESTCSDVLLYWLASAAVLKDLFSLPKSGLSKGSFGQASIKDSRKCLRMPFVRCTGQHCSQIHITGNFMDCSMVTHFKIQPRPPLLVAIVQA